MANKNIEDIIPEEVFDCTYRVVPKPFEPTYCALMRERAECVSPHPLFTCPYIDGPEVREEIRRVSDELGSLMSLNRQEKNCVGPEERNELDREASTMRMYHSNLQKLLVL